MVGSGFAAAPAPPTVAGEVVRERLVALLESRWDVPVTTVVAGAGFGKSIAVAQAVRQHQLDPRGIEGWLSCRSASGTEDDLARRILSSLGAEHDDATPASMDLVLRTVVDRAPLEVCVVLDDVDALGGAPAIAAPLERLVNAAPGNFHLVLVGRELPSLPLSRLRAASQVLELDAEALRMTDAEAGSLARDDAERERLVAVGGWPALVRLSLAAGGRVTDYLWEEVLRNLTEQDRRTLLALSCTGPADAATLEAVCGHPVETDGFGHRVPLVHEVDGRLQAHDLWRDALADLLPADELETMSRSAAAHLLGQHDVIGAGTLAARHGFRDLLDRCAVELVLRLVANLPVATAEEWLAAVPPSDRSLELELLAAAVAHARDMHAPPVAVLDHLVERAAVTTPPGRTLQAALALSTLAAYDSGEAIRLFLLAQLIETVPGAAEQRELQLVQRGVAAGLAELQGDIATGLAALDEPIPGFDRRAYPEPMNRLHWHLLLLAGEAGRAATHARDNVEDTARPGGRPLTAVARWFDGDPDGFPGGAAAVFNPRGGASHGERDDVRDGDGDGLEQRDQFVQATFAAVLLACVGDRERIAAAVATIDRAPRHSMGPTDLALAEVARAAQEIVGGDEPGAARRLHDLVDSQCSDDGSVASDAHLRRSLAIPYVCVPTLKDVWDAAELGPSQVRTRAIAGALVDARHGRPPADALDPAAVHTALPLPWSVELAARLVATERADGLVLGQWLGDRIGPVVLDELRRLADDGDEPARAGASALLAGLAVPPATVLEVQLLGPLRLVRGGEVIDAQEARRARVRELLAVLVLRHTLSRATAVDLLWPDLDPERGRRNLRVTLTHLQRLIEPDRQAGELPFHLRVDGEQLRLVAGPSLLVDCWQLDEHLEAAAAARARGDSRARAGHLHDAVRLWRGRPLPDLDRIDELAPAVQSVRRSLVDAALALGELRVVSGEPDAAVELAERVLAEDPYDERAHRLAIAALLHRGDGSGVGAAVERLGRTLDELGAEPDERTRILLRQATRRRSP